MITDFCRATWSFTGSLELVESRVSEFSHMCHTASTCENSLTLYSMQERLQHLPGLVKMRMWGSFFKNYQEFQQGRAEPYPNCGVPGHRTVHMPRRTLWLSGTLSLPTGQLLECDQLRRRVKNCRKKMKVFRTGVHFLQCQHLARWYLCARCTPRAES